MAVITPGDKLLLVPTDTFAVPLILERSTGNQDQTSPPVFRLLLSLTDYHAFSDLLAGQVQELTAVDLGRRLAQDNAVRLVCRRVLRAAPEARAEVLAEGLEETLELVGLQLNSPPTEVRNERGEGERTALHIGYVVGDRWRLARKLGEGSFGEVWLAQDTTTQSLERALKFVHQPDLASSVRREARRLLELERAGIDWRHLARLMDVLPGNAPCLVYEFINGPDLPAYARERGVTLPLAEVLTIVDQILVGLAELHRTGIIHRDLHPGNVRIDRRQPTLTAKILDLGLAWPRTTMQAEDPTVSALLIEPTHPYAERMVQRQGLLPDDRTDLHSVGTILWWLLTGQHGLPMGQSLSEAWPDCPSALQDVVRRACVLPRDQRYASAHAMVAALRQAAHELGVSLHAATPPSSSAAAATMGARPLVTLRADGSGAYPTLEDAVREAPAGAVIELGSGDYWLSQPLEITRSLTLVGKGIEKTRLVCRSPGHVARFRESGPFGAWAIQFVHQGEHPSHVVIVAGGEIDFRVCGFTGAVHDGTTNQGGIGLLLEGDTYGSVRQCGSFDNDVAGILVRGETQATLEANLCERNGGVGMSFLGKAAGVARLNTSSRNKLVGMHVAGRARPVLEGNTCDHNGRDGFAFFETTAAVARQNIARGNDRDGFCVEGTGDLVLESNSCSENVRSGITFTKNSMGRACENICHENGEAGIAITDHARPVLEKNTCRENHGAGIAYMEDASGTAVQNACHANGREGISLTDRAQPMLDANTCRENGASGISYLPMARGTARGNVCAANRGAGISVANFTIHEWRANILEPHTPLILIVKGNACHGNLEAGIAIRGLSKSILEANTCENNKQGGISYHDTASGTAQENACRDNEPAGILIGDSASPTLERNTCERNTETGIGYIGSATGSVGANICSNNAGNGISVGYQAKPKVVANTCEANTNSGLAYYQIGAGIAVGNVCNGNGHDGITVQHQALPFLEGNTCMHNQRNGISYRDQAAGTCQQNRCEGNAAGIVTAHTSRPQMKNNICQGNANDRGKGHGLFSRR